MTSPLVAKCSCAEIEGEDPDCDLHGVSVRIWASWTDDECLMCPDIDSFTVRRKSQEAAELIEQLVEALEKCTTKLRRCASNAGNADFAVRALVEPFEAALAKAHQADQQR